MSSAETRAAGAGQTFADKVRVALDAISTTQHGAIGRAADLIAEAVCRNGVIHAFGAGHSEAVAMELVGRAGGLVAANRIAFRDLVILGGEDPAVLADLCALERDPTVARRLYELASPQPEDIFVIVSHSGVNSVVVELALLARERGHRIIAITSPDHSWTVASGHNSGRRLIEVADVVLDNAAPVGDACVPLPGGVAVGALSLITGAFLVENVVVRAAERLVREGARLPVYLSSNIPGGEEHNRALEREYRGRLRRMA